MLDIQQNAELTKLNTFGIQITSRYFTIIKSAQQLKALLELKIFQDHPILVLGGGSNLLFTKKIFDGLTIKNEIKGIEKVKENDTHVWLKVGAGEVWHTFVLSCIENNWGGVENLSLIPGSVGAAPMQNIGAYGIEVKDVIETVDAFDLHSGDSMTFTNDQCQFGYRESMFKHEGKNRYFITHVTFRLTKQEHHYNIAYGAIQEFLSKMNINELSLKAVSDAVIAIRQSKLPDPVRIGNAGSFFKNPTIRIKQYELLRVQHPSMPSYTIDD